MREIKFKFWHKEYKKFISPYGLGYQFQPENGQIYIDGCNITDRFIISQYTGLKDKNGKEIYEGDVIIGEAEIPCEVIWDIKNGCFRGNAINMSHVTIPAEAFVRREIIGNIYEMAVMT